MKRVCRPNRRLLEIPADCLGVIATFLALEDIFLSYRLVCRLMNGVLNILPARFWRSALYRYSRLPVPTSDVDAGTPWRSVCLQRVVAVVRHLRIFHSGQATTRDGFALLQSAENTEDVVRMPSGDEEMPSPEVCRSSRRLLRLFSLESPLLHYDLEIIDRCRTSTGPPSTWDFVYGMFICKVNGVLAYVYEMEEGANWLNHDLLYKVALDTSPRLHRARALPNSPPLDRLLWFLATTGTAYSHMTSLYSEDLTAEGNGLEMESSDVHPTVQSFLELDLTQIGSTIEAEDYDVGGFTPMEGEDLDEMVDEDGDFMMADDDDDDDDFDDDFVVHDVDDDDGEFSGGQVDDLGVVVVVDDDDEGPTGGVVVIDDDEDDDLVIQDDDDVIVLDEDDEDVVLMTTNPGGGGTRQSDDEDDSDDDLMIID